MPDLAAWSLANFLPELDRWVAQEQPSDELRRQVIDWIFSRYDDPYQGVRREPDFENLWFGAVPGTRRAGRLVACSYFIYETSRTVACDSFATLTWPI